MKRLLGPVFAACILLLTGCASTIDSEVTAFHAWPNDLKDKSFVFTPVKDQEGRLEYLNYEQLIRAQLLRLGFTPAASATTAALKVAFSYGSQSGAVVVPQPVYDPFWYGPGWHRAWGPWGPGPFYDPFWSPPMQNVVYPTVRTRLFLNISRVDNDQKLYEVTVDSDNTDITLPTAMPYLVRSAFADFPGPSGVSRHVELKLDKNSPTTAP